MSLNGRTISNYISVAVMTKNLEMVSELRTYLNRDENTDKLKTVLTAFKSFVKIPDLVFDTDTIMKVENGQEITVDSLLKRFSIVKEMHYTDTEINSIKEALLLLLVDGTQQSDTIHCSTTVYNTFFSFRMMNIENVRYIKFFKATTIFDSLNWTWLVLRGKIRDESEVRKLHFEFLMSIYQVLLEGNETKALGLISEKPTDRVMADV